MSDNEEWIAFVQGLIERDLYRWEIELLLALQERKEIDMFIPRAKEGSLTTAIQLLVLEMILNKAKEEAITLEESLNRFIKANQSHKSTIDITEVRGGYGKCDENPLPKYGSKFEIMVKLMNN